MIREAKTYSGAPKFRKFSEIANIFPANTKRKFSFPFVTTFSRRVDNINYHNLGCGNVEVYRRFAEKFCSHLQDTKELLLDNRVSHLRLRLSSLSLHT